MASTPRSSIDDSYASNMRCKICGAEALHVGHAGKLPDYVSCHACSSAFLVEDGGERIFYGQIAPGFPETEAFALRQWAFPEAVEKLARPERPTLPEITAEPTLEPEPAPPAVDLSQAGVEMPVGLPGAEDTPAPEPEPIPARAAVDQGLDPHVEGDDSAFAAEFGFLEELAQTGPSSEPPAETFKGLVDSDEPHAADALTPPPWAKGKPGPEAGTLPAAEEESLPTDGLAEAEPVVDEEPSQYEAAIPAAPDEGPPPVQEIFEEPVPEPGAPHSALPTPDAGEEAPAEFDSFKFEDDDIPGEPVDLGQLDDPLGLASAFEALTLDPGSPAVPEDQLSDDFSGELEPGTAWAATSSPAQASEELDERLAGISEITPDEVPAAPESESPDSTGPAPTDDLEPESYWLSGTTPIPGDEDAITLESSTSPAIDLPAAEDFAAEDGWLTSMAASPAEDDPTTIESSGSRAAQAEPGSEDVDWLAAMAETPLDEMPNDTGHAPEAAVEPSPAVDWLSEIKDDELEEPEPAEPEPAPADKAHPAGEPAADEDWLAALSKSTDDGGDLREAEIDWLASIGDTAAAGDEPMHTVTNWLSSRADSSKDEAGTDDDPDSGIDWLGAGTDPSTGEQEPAGPQDFAALRGAEPEPSGMQTSSDEDDEIDASYDPFDFNQRIANLKAEAQKEKAQDADEDDFLSGLRRSAAIPLESEPLDNTPLASVNLDSQPFIKSKDQAGAQDEDSDPLAMAARMGAVAASADDAGLPTWMADAGDESKPRSAVGAFKLRDTDPPTGQRYRVVLRGDRVVFPSGDCAHCGRTPVKGRLAVFGTLPNGQKVGQRKVTSFNVPLCAECRARAAQLTEEAGNARLQAHLISAIIGMVLVVLSLVVGIIDPHALALPDLMILAILLIVGYAGPATFLLNRVGNYPPPTDAIYVRTTLIVPSETQGLETAFEWRNSEYAQRFFDANQAVTLGKMTSVKDRLASLES